VSILGGLAVWSNVFLPVNERCQMPLFRKTPPKTQSEVQSLDCRYGKIGISAVAAAMRYQSERKNMAYAPVAPRGDRWQSEDLAA
jgi:hypothetical protein